MARSTTPRTGFAGLVVLLSVVSLVTAAGAAPFVNLNFEQSTVLPTDPQVVPTSAAFPGWTALINGSPTDFVYHNAQGGGEPVVAVYDMPVVGAGFPLLQGRCMAYLAPSADDVRTALRQVADVPEDAQSLKILCDGEAGPPLVTIDGIALEFVRLSGTIFHGVSTWGADISPYAGSTRALMFGCGPRQELLSGRRVLDDVQFSPSAVPEPGLPIIHFLLFSLILDILKGRELRPRRYDQNDLTNFRRIT